MKRFPFQDSAYQLKTPSGTYAQHRFSRTHSSFLELWRDEASPPVIVTYVTTLDHVCKFCVLCVRLAGLGNPGRRFHRFWSAVVQHPDHSQGLVGAVLSLVSGIHGYSKFTQKKGKLWQEARHDGCRLAEIFGISFTAAAHTSPGSRLVAYVQLPRVDERE